MIAALYSSGINLAANFFCLWELKYYRDFPDLDKIVYEGAIDNNHLMKVFSWKYFQRERSQKYFFLKLRRPSWTTGFNPRPNQWSKWFLRHLSWWVDFPIFLVWLNLSLGKYQTKANISCIVYSVYITVKHQSSVIRTE